jgi:hypothetical protein
MATESKPSCNKTSIDSQLLKVIKQTKDPVNLTVTGWQWFCNTEFWCFRPAWWKFFAITLPFVLYEFCELLVSSPSYDYTLLRILLMLNVPIFVIGISIITLAHRLGESGEFTAEYLHKACKLPVFAYQSFSSVSFAVAAIALPSSHSLDWVRELLIYAALGSTVIIIPSFLFIILTLIRCANPKEAIETMTKFSTMWQVNALAKDIYFYHQTRQEPVAITDKYKPPSEEEWDIHLAKILNAFKKAMDARDLEQIQAWLDCTLKPIHLVVDVCKRFPVFQEKYGYAPHRFYEMVRIYVLALNQLLALEKRANLWFVEDSILLIFKAVQKEVHRLLKSENYYCLRPLCWVVVGLYSQLFKSEYSQDLRRQRAYFGSFYVYPTGLFKELPNDCKPDTKSHFRQILHEGLSLWLLTAIKEKDNELVESLFEAGRELVFGDDTVDLKTDKALLQHLVLSGKLISDLMTDKPDIASAKNIEMLFPDSYRSLPIGLSDLSMTYEKSCPTLATDLDRFVEQLGDAWERTHYNPLTGSSSYSGTRYHGRLEPFTTGFLYAAALIIKNNLNPDPIHLDITRVKSRLQDMRNHFIKLQNKITALDIYFNVLSKWIDACVQEKNKQDKRA